VPVNGITSDGCCIPNENGLAPGDEAKGDGDGAPLASSVSAQSSFGDNDGVPDNARALQLRRRRRPVSLLFLAAMLTPTWACGGGGNGQEIQRYEGDLFSLEIPADWRTEERAEAGAGAGVLFLSPDPVRNARAMPNEVFVFRPEGRHESLQAYVAEEYNLESITVHEERQIEVAGAAEGLRIVTEGTTEPPAVTIHQIFVLALLADGAVVDAVCRGAADDFEQQSCDRILSSLRITHP
jgi:hypothetical protein